jgi:hypothetical protein
MRDVRRSKTVPTKMSKGAGSELKVAPIPETPSIIANPK